MPKKNFYFGIGKAVADIVMAVNKPLGTLVLNWVNANLTDVSQFVTGSIFSSSEVEKYMVDWTGKVLLPWVKKLAITRLDVSPSGYMKFNELMEDLSVANNYFSTKTASTIKGFKPIQAQEINRHKAKAIELVGRAIYVSYFGLLEKKIPGTFFRGTKTINAKQYTGYPLEKYLWKGNPEIVINTIASKQTKSSATSKRGQLPHAGIPIDPFPHGDIPPDPSGTGGVKPPKTIPKGPPVLKKTHPIRPLPPKKDGGTELETGYETPPFDPGTTENGNEKGNGEDRPKKKKLFTLKNGLIAFGVIALGKKLLS